MPNKTLYVQDRDLPLWERADRAAKTRGITMSALVNAALTRELGGATDTIQVYVHGHSPTDGATGHTVAFTGRWLTNPRLESNGVGDGPAPEPDAQPWTDRSHTGAPTEWVAAIAETGRGRIAVYIHHWNYDYDQPSVLTDFDTLEAAQDAYGADPRVPTILWDEARNALHNIPATTHIEFREI
jgi:hypothetical protein